MGSGTELPTPIARVGQRNDLLSTRELLDRRWIDFVAAVAQLSLDDFCVQLQECSVLPILQHPLLLLP